MLKDFSRNTLLDMPLSDDVLPDIIRYQNLDNAHRLLLYVLRRPDNQFEAPHIEPLLRHARRVEGKYIMEFYASLSSLVRALNHYIRMEESVSYSGKYRKDLDIAREQVGRILEAFESAPDRREINYLANMIA